MQPWSWVHSGANIGLHRDRVLHARLMSPRVSPSSIMPVKRTKLPNQLLILGNTEYLFGEVKKADDLWRVVRTFDCNGVATVCITTIGTFGFIFPDSSRLASIDTLKYSGPGHAPKEVMDRRNG